MQTEIELVNRCREGDAEARRELYERYGGVLFAICCRYARDRDTAQDIMHDGFITILTKLNDFRGDGSFEGWCKRIMVNCALGHLRKNNPLNRAVDVDEAIGLYDPDTDIVSKMSNDDLIECIGELPEGYKTILNLYAVEGYSHKEIGQMLDISENTSRSQYSRARIRLAQMLERRGVTNAG